MDLRSMLTTLVERTGATGRVDGGASTISSYITYLLTAYLAHMFTSSDDILANYVDELSSYVYRIP